MDKIETANKAYALAYEYEQKYGDCPQCVLAALQETIGGIDDAVFRAAHPLAGGSGLCGIGTCGALVGGMLAIGTRFGRSREKFTEKSPRRSYKLSKQLLERFVGELGSPICRGVQEHIFGRSFDLWDIKEYQEFLDKGGHVDKCPQVAAQVAEWTVEILFDADDGHMW